MSTFNNKSLCDEALVKYHDVTHCRAIRCLVSLRHFLKEMYWFLKTCLSSSLLLGMHVGETLSLLIKHISIWYLLLLKKKGLLLLQISTLLQWVEFHTRHLCIGEICLCVCQFVILCSISESEKHFLPDTARLKAFVGIKDRNYI